MASPDDSIDPVQFGEAYDKATYHTFAKPDGFEWPTVPKHWNRTPEVGEWVTIVERHLTTDGKNLRGAEGKLQSIQGDTATVRLGGFMAMLNTEDIPLNLIRPVVFDAYHTGVPVRVTRGPKSGTVGVVTDILLGGVVEVSQPDGTLIGKFNSDQISPNQD